MTDKKKGHFTIRSAGILFIISAIFEVMSVTSAVALFGGVRGGNIAIFYHILFFLVFMAIGIALLRAQPWCFKAVVTGTVFYSLDKIQFLLDRRTLDDQILAIANQITKQLDQLSQAGLIGKNLMAQVLAIMAEKELIMQVMNLTVGLFIASWLGFTLYIYLRRDYFAAENT